MNGLLMKAETLKEMVAGFERFSRENAELISKLDQEISAADPKGEITEDLFWDQVDGMKGYMGAESANQTSDDENEQENAISGAEDWVSNNVSSSDAAKIAATLWLNGVEEGAAMIRKALNEGK